MNFLLFLPFLFMMLGVMSVLAAGDVGFTKYNDSVWKFWNTGPIENETYIGSDMSQIANRPERFSWGLYSDCLFSSGGIKICDFDLGGLNLTPLSDNKTFWKGEGNKSFLLSSRSNLFGKKFEQNRYDEYVNRTVYWSADAVSTSSTRWFLGWCISNLSIEGDWGDDWFNFQVNGSKWMYFNTSDKSYWGFQSFNVTSSYVNVRDVEGITWRFTDSLQHGVSWDGNSLCVMGEVGRGSLKGLYSQRFQWIDVLCELNVVPIDPEFPECGPFGRSLVQRCVKGGSLISCISNSTGYVNLRAELWTIDCLYTGSPGCTETTYGNGSSSDLREIPASTSTTERFISCLNPTSPECGYNSLVNNYFSVNPIQCRREGQYDAFMNASFFSPDELSDYILVNCTNDLLPPAMNVSGITTTITLGSSFLLNTSMADNSTNTTYPLSNITLYLNTTGPSLANLTISLFANYTAKKNWSGGFGAVGDYRAHWKGCDNNGYCINSSNITLTVSAPIPSIGISHLFSRYLLGGLLSSGWWV